MADVEVSFTATGMVNATVYEDYGIICYTFRKDGEIVKESRTFDVSEGWVTDTRNSDGVWHYETARKKSKLPTRPRAKRLQSGCAMVNELLFCRPKQARCSCGL